jgi:phage terminase large subunit-like protein
VSEFKSQNLNVEPTNREAGVAVWIQPRDWRAAEDPSITSLDSLIKRCTRVALGIDCGGAHDLTAMAAIGRDADGKHLLWTHHWLSRAGFDEQRARGPFGEAVAAGELTVVDRVGDDVKAAVDLVRDLHGRGALCGIGCDPYGLKEATTAMQAITGREAHGISQGWRLSPHLDEVERAVLAGTLQHHRSALLDWQFSNAHVRFHGEARALVKPDGVMDSSRKIDGAIATVCAWAVFQVEGAKRPIEYQIDFIGGAPAREGWRAVR